MRARVGMGVVLAYGGTAWLHGLHAASAQQDWSSGTSALHFLRDGTLSLLLVVPAVLIVFAMIARLRPASRMISLARAMVAVVGVTTAVFLSGAIGHTLIFPSEHASADQAVASAVAPAAQAAPGASVALGAVPPPGAPGAPVAAATKPGFHPHQPSAAWLAKTGQANGSAKAAAGPHAAHNGAAKAPAAPAAAANPHAAHNGAASSAGTTGAAVAESATGGHMEATSGAALFEHGAIEAARVFPVLLPLALAGLVLGTRRSDDVTGGYAPTPARRARSVVASAPRRSRRVIAVAASGHTHRSRHRFGACPGQGLPGRGGEAPGTRERPRWLRARRVQHPRSPPVSY